MNAVSVYSGIGGFDLAAHYAGFNIVAQIEQDEFCRRVLAYHAKQYWPAATQFVSDTDFNAGCITHKVDLIFGGFPCQPHSVAGNAKGKEDDRNRWPEFARIIGDLRPRAILLENVPNIVNTVGADIIADLAKMGYVGSAGIVSAADACAGHIRDRWWCVCFLADTLGDRRQGAQSAQETAHHQKRNREAHQPAGCAVGSQNITGSPVLVNTSGPGLQKPDAPAEPGSAGHATWRPDPQWGTRCDEHGMGFDVDGLPGWLVEHRRPAGQGQRQFEWEPPRTIPKEQARSDPDYASKIKAIGNAVFVPTAFALMLNIRHRLEQA